MDVGQIIRGARRLSNLTQFEVARRAETSQTTFAAYETGKKSPRIDTLERLAEAMGGQLRLEILLIGTDEDRALGTAADGGRTSD